MKPTYIRLNEQGLEVAQSLAKERNESQPEIIRRATGIGLYILAAFGPPDLDRGTYGSLAPDELAEKLRPYSLVINDFLQRYSQALPTHQVPLSQEKIQELLTVDAGMMAAMHAVEYLDLSDEEEVKQ